MATASAEANHSAGNRDDAGLEPVMDLRPDRGFARLRHAMRDIAEGFGLYRLVLTLGWLDIKLQYRGSMLGPFWLTASTAIMVTAMGVLYATLFHTDLHIYLPFLSFSLVLWGYLNSVVTDGCTAFTRFVSLIHAARMPFSVHALRSVLRNLFTFLHNFAVVLVVFAIFHITPKLDWHIPAAMVIWLVDTLALTLLLGVLGTRFRDMPPIAASVMQILFFITPVLWQPDLIYVGRQYMLLDPCYPLLEILRAPFMGHVARPSIWFAALAYSGALWLFTILLFARMRARLAYWV